MPQASGALPVQPTMMMGLMQGMPMQPTSGMPLGLPAGTLFANAPAASAGLQIPGLASMPGFSMGMTFGAQVAAQQGGPFTLPSQPAAPAAPTTSIAGTSGRAVKGGRGGGRTAGRGRGAGAKGAAAKSEADPSSSAGEDVSDSSSDGGGETKQRKKQNLSMDDAERRHQALQEKNRRAQRRFRERQKVSWCGN